MQLVSNAAKKKGNLIQMYTVPPLVGAALFLGYSFLQHKVHKEKMSKESVMSAVITGAFLGLVVIAAGEYMQIKREQNQATK